MMKLGVNTVLFGKYDLRTAMQHIKWAGYDAVEISAIKGMCEHLCLDTWKKDAADIKALIQDLQLPITAMEEAGLDESRLDHPAVPQGGKTLPGLGGRFHLRQ